MDKSDTQEQRQRFINLLELVGLAHDSVHAGRHQGVVLFLENRSGNSHNFDFMPVLQCAYAPWLVHW